MSARRQITAADIMPLDAYTKVRDDKRRALLATKRLRRLPVGPDATFYFESYETMWLQIHEMLFIEKGGEEQVPDELAAYNPLIPQGNELIATVMFEIDDRARRAAVLGRLGGVEDHFVLEIDGQIVRGESEQDVDRTSAAGKASSVQFVHFPLSATQKAAFKTAGTRIIVGTDHPHYLHMAGVPEDTRAELAKDLS